MSYVRHTNLDTCTDITEAMYMAGLTREDCIELCDITQRTWYRWIAHGAPRWALRLILSQQGTLDRFGWKSWEIRRGALYCNELHHRYYWEPIHLLLPLYGIRDPAAPHIARADNLSSIYATASFRNRQEHHRKKPAHEPTQDEALDAESNNQQMQIT